MGSMTASFAAATKKAATTAMMIGMSMFLGTASGQENDDVTALRPLYFKQWRDPVKVRIDHTQYFYCLLLLYSLVSIVVS